VWHAVRLTHLKIMGSPNLKLHKGPAELHPPLPEDDALSAFAAESETHGQPPAPVVRTPGRSRKFSYVAAAFGAVVIVGAATIAYVATRPTGDQGFAATPPAAGNAFIDSRPQGADIVIDGISRGATPAKISLTPGRHALELKAQDTSRTFTLDIDPGTTISHYVEMGPTMVIPAVATGRLEVSTDPPGAQVTVNGTQRGRTPLTVADLQPGEVSVSLANGSGTVNRRVAITAGNTASVFASLGAAETAAGWVVFKAPIDLEIFEATRLIGTTATDRLMLPAGRHDLELVNTALQFRRAITVQVGAGTTVTPAIDVPNGSLSVNALPWAEVWINGKSLGTTPLGNLALPIGSYEIVWRHPQFGERKRTVSVIAGSPVRVGVDFNQ
jgi:PEGA domain